MNPFTSQARHDMPVAEDHLIPEHFEEPERVKWELDQTPEALYARINDISTLFSSGKYTKVLAVQRLLDLLYDINQLSNEVAFSKTAKSRYYLLIFNYIYQIRSARFRIADFVRRRKTLAEMLLRKLLMTDQMMYINDVDFSGMSLPNLRVSHALFKNCNFSNSIFQGLGASQCHFEDCNFSSANLKNMASNSCQFIQCRFDAVNLTNSDVVSSSFEGVTLTGSNLSASRIIKTSFVGCDFCEIISSRGQLPLRANGCDFLACSFREADLRGADFRNTRMAGCDTLDAKKENAKGLA